MHDPENSLFEAKNGFWPEKCRLGAQKNGKKWAFGDYLQNLPSKKVATHLPTFLMVIESPLHWPFVRDIFFPLILLLERCEHVDLCDKWRNVWYGLLSHSSIVRYTLLFHSLSLVNENQIPPFLRWHLLDGNGIGTQNVWSRSMIAKMHSSFLFYSKE